VTDLYTCVEQALAIIVSESGSGVSQVVRRRVRNPEGVVRGAFPEGAQGRLVATRDLTPALHLELWGSRRVAPRRVFSKALAAGLKPLGCRSVRANSWPLAAFCRAFCAA